MFHHLLPLILKVEHRSLTLGEVLDGDRMAISLYEVQFNVSSSHKELCTRELSNKNIEKLQAAIEDLYYFEFVFGEIRMNFTCAAYHRNTCQITSSQFI